MPDPGKLQALLGLPPKPQGPRNATDPRGRAGNAAVRIDKPLPLLPHEMRNAAPLKGKPLLPEEVPFPEELRAGAWQDSRGTLSRIRQPRTGLSGKLRAVEAAFDQARLGFAVLDHSQSEPEFAVSRLKDLEDLRGRLDDAMAHADGIKRHGQDVAAVMARLSDLQRKVAGRIAFLGQEDLTGVIRRDAVYTRPHVGVLLSIHEKAPSLVSRAQELLAAVNTLQDAEESLSNDDSLPWRTLTTYPKFWQEVIPAREPDLFAAFGRNYLGDVIPEVIRSVGSGKFLVAIRAELNAEQDSRQDVFSGVAYDFGSVRVASALVSLRQEVHEALPGLPGRLDRLLAWLEDPQ